MNLETIGYYQNGDEIRVHPLEKTSRGFAEYLEELLTEDITDETRVNILDVLNYTYTEL